MQTQHHQHERASAKAEDLAPTPTQAENDAAMIAATGGDAAPDVPPVEGARKAEEKPAHEPERRVPAR